MGLIDGVETDIIDASNVDNATTVEAILLEFHEKDMDIAVDDLFKVQEELNRIRNEKRQTDKLYEITYILYENTLGFDGLKANWCIFSIKEVKKNENT